MNKKSRHNFTLDKNLVNWLRDYCNENDISLSETINNQIEALSSSMKMESPVGLFLPKNKFRWILDIKDGSVDSFLMMKFFPPGVKDGKFLDYFSFQLWDTLDCRPAKQIKELVYSPPFDSKIIFLDNLGNKISRYEYRGCKVKNVTFDNMDYRDKSEGLKISVDVKFRDFEIF